MSEVLIEPLARRRCQTMHGKVTHTHLVDSRSTPPCIIIVKRQKGESK